MKRVSGDSGRGGTLATAGGLHSPIELTPTEVGLFAVCNPIVMSDVLYSGGFSQEGFSPITFTQVR